MVATREQIAPLRLGNQHEPDWAVPGHDANAQASMDAPASMEHAEIPMPHWKRAFDIVAASGLLLIALPFMALIGAMVALSSRGGAVYAQTRIGHGGRAFTCYKFRTMVRDADRMKPALEDGNIARGPLFKMRSDPRCTPIGTVLRKTSLDELPQLWNVLRGEMSLVGPRPPLPSEVALYEPHHFARLTVVPGMTGLWQVTARKRHDFADMVVLDAQYAATLGPLTDLGILLKTLPTVLRGDGSC